jgi:iron complex transport system substrate-binding protein
MQTPGRIASLLASATEILYALGLGEHVVAIGHECDFPIEARTKPRATFTNIAVAAGSQAIDDQVRELLMTGRPLYEIDRNLLASFAPDLIVTQAQCDVCAVKYDDVMVFVHGEPALQHTQVVALNPTRLEDLFTDIERVADATGRRDQAESYIAQLRGRIATVRERTSTIDAQRRPIVGCIEWNEPLMLAANWMPDLIELAGGTQPFTQAGVHSTCSSWDDFFATDPDCIILMPCGFDLERTLLEAHELQRRPEWSKLKAVHAGRVFAVDGNAYFNRSGPRLVESLEILARLLHPQLFGYPSNASGEDGIWRRFGPSTVLVG